MDKVTQSRKDVTSAFLMVLNELSPSKTSNQPSIRFRNRSVASVEKAIFQKVEQEGYQELLNSAEVSDLVDKLMNDNNWQKLEANTFAIVARMLLVSQHCLAVEQGLFRLMDCLKAKAQGGPFNDAIWKVLVANDEGSDDKARLFKATTGKSLVPELFVYLVDSKGNSRTKRWCMWLLADLMDECRDNLKLAFLRNIDALMSLYIECFCERGDIITKIAFACILCNVFRSLAVEAKDQEKLIRQICKNVTEEQFAILKALKTHESLSTDWFKQFMQWDELLSYSNSRSAGSSITFYPILVGIDSAKFSGKHVRSLACLDDKYLSIFTYDMSTAREMWLDLGIDRIVDLSRKESLSHTVQLELEIEDVNEAEYTYLKNMEEIAESTIITLLCREDEASNVVNYVQKVCHNLAMKSSMPTNVPYISTKMQRTTISQLDRRRQEVAAAAATSPPSETAAYDFLEDEFPVPQQSPGNQQKRTQEKSRTNSSEIFVRLETNNAEDVASGTLNVKNDNLSRLSKIHTVVQSKTEKDKQFQTVGIPTRENTKKVSPTVDSKDITARGRKRLKDSMTMHDGSSPVQEEEQYEPQGTKGRKTVPKKASMKLRGNPLKNKTTTTKNDVYDFPEDELSDEPILSKPKATKTMDKKAQKSAPRKATKMTMTQSKEVTKPKSKTTRVIHKTAVTKVGKTNKSLPKKGNRKLQEFSSEDDFDPSVDDEGDVVASARRKPLKPTRPTLSRAAARKADKRIEKIADNENQSTQDDFVNNVSDNDEESSADPGRASSEEDSSAKALTQVKDKKQKTSKVNDKLSDSSSSTGQDNTIKLLEHQAVHDLSFTDIVNMDTLPSSPPSSETRDILKTKVVSMEKNQTKDSRISEKDDKLKNTAIVADLKLIVAAKQMFDKSQSGTSTTSKPSKDVSIGLKNSTSDVSTTMASDDKSGSKRFEAKSLPQSHQDTSVKPLLRNDSAAVDVVHFGTSGPTRERVKPPSKRKEPKTPTNEDISTSPQASVVTTPERAETNENKTPLMQVDTKKIEIDKKGSPVWSGRTRRVTTSPVDDIFSEPPLAMGTPGTTIKAKNMEADNEKDKSHYFTQKPTKTQKTVLVVRKEEPKPGERHTESRSIAIVEEENIVQSPDSDADAEADNDEEVSRKAVTFDTAPKVQKVKPSKDSKRGVVSVSNHTFERTALKVIPQSTEDGVGLSGNVKDLPKSISKTDKGAGQALATSEPRDTVSQENVVPVMQSKHWDVEQTLIPSSSSDTAQEDAVEESQDSQDGAALPNKTRSKQSTKAQDADWTSAINNHTPQIMRSLTKIMQAQINYLLKPGEQAIRAIESFEEEVSNLCEKRKLAHEQVIEKAKGELVQVKESAFANYANAASKLSDVRLSGGSIKSTKDVEKQNVLIDKLLSDAFAKVAVLGTTQGKP